MTTDRPWGRRALSLAGLVAAVVVAMIVLNPSRPQSPNEPGPTQTLLSPAEEYAHHALTIMGQHSFFVDEATWWPGVVRETMAAVRDATSPAETYGALDTALAAAAGPQGLLLRPKQVPLPEVAELPAVSEGDGLGRVTVSSVGPVIPQDVSARATALADVIGVGLPAATCGWIIDLRTTRSQEDWGVLAGLSGFLREGPLFGLKDRYGRVFHVSAAMGSVFLDGRPMATVEHPVTRIARPAAVLQSADTTGVGEALVLALRQGEHVRTFGAATRGLPFTERFALSDGAELVLPTARLTDRAGNDDTRGVPADAPTDTPEQAATEWLHSQCRRK